MGPLSFCTELGIPQVAAQPSAEPQNDEPKISRGVFNRVWRRLAALSFIGDSVPSAWRDACCCLLASEASCCSPRAVCAPGEPLAQPQLCGPRSQTCCWWPGCCCPAAGSGPAGSGPVPQPPRGHLPISVHETSLERGRAAHAFAALLKLGCVQPPGCWRGFDLRSAAASSINQRSPGLRPP